MKYIVEKLKIKIIAGDFKKIYSNSMRQLSMSVNSFADDEGSRPLNSLASKI